MPRSATIERTPTRLPSPPGPADRSRRSLRGPAGSTLFGLGFALVFFVLELRPLLDNSFLWHLKTGHWILDHHRIPGHDLFSFTAAGEPWVVQSWLAEVLYAAVDRVFGSFGLRLLRAGTAAAIAFLVFKLAARLVGDRVRGALLTLATLGMAVIMWAERPLLFGVLAMVVLVWTVEVPESRVGRHALVVIPPIMWIWANMHGTFAVGFGYLVLHLVGRALDGHRPTGGRERVLLAATLVAAVACLANPLGLSLLTFPIHLLSRGDTLAHIREWQSPDFHSAAGMIFAIWMAIVIAAMVRGRERATRRDVLIVLAFLFLSLWATRNLVLTPIVVLPILARTLAVAPARRAEDRHLPRQLAGRRSPGCFRLDRCRPGRRDRRIRLFRLPGQGHGGLGAAGPARASPVHHRRVGGLRHRPILAPPARLHRRPLRHVPHRPGGGLLHRHPGQARLAGRPRPPPDRRDRLADGPARGATP